MSACFAVHRRGGADRWLKFCVDRGIPHKAVECYRSDILAELASCNALLWHWTHGSSRDLLMARRAGLRPSLDVVAELGPGHSIGTGLAALLSGAEKYVGLDVVPFASNAQNVRIFEERVALFKARADIPDGREFPRGLRIRDGMYFMSGDRNV